MLRKMGWMMLAVALCWAPWTLAREVAGVVLPEQVSVAGAPLKLNGAGVRSRFFFKVYVGALYLTRTSHRSSDIYPMDGPKRMQMHFLYSKIERQKLRDAWVEGFVRNLTSAQLSELKPRLDEFVALFPAVVEGDVLTIDYSPRYGVQVSHNDRLLGTVYGADLFTALLKVWLGEDPADASLKEGLLGVD